MSERFALIARKQEVRQRIERLRRQLEREQTLKGDSRRVRNAQNELERLMAEEYNLRVAIDRSK